MKLYGKNPVIERIKRNPSSIKKLYLQKKTDLSSVVKEAKEGKVDFISSDKAFISELAQGAHTQGVIAEVDEFRYEEFSNIVSRALKKKTVLVFLDGVTDPQNLGGVIRNLACLGGFSLILPEHDAAWVNETVLRVANGGENYVKVAKVANIATTLKKIKEKGIWTAGAVVENAVDIKDAEFNFPLAVVIGSEGKGIRPGVLKGLDERVFLPMPGAQLSYNVATAAALFCYEVTKRK